MKYIDAGKLISEIKGIIAAVQTKSHPDALGTMEQCLAAAEIEALNLVLDDIKELQQEQPKERLIQVKCLYPYDESWQENKVYTCKVWHHGYLNRDFWDVYYDYGKDPRYVQFASIGLLNEEFVVIQEQSEADLEKASRHVYESWNGGTMDDVRRDMVELGKVLNAREK